MFGIALSQSLQALIDLIGISTAIGLTFSVLTPPRRTATNYYFALFSMSVATFLLLMMSQWYPQLMPFFTNTTRLYAVSTAFALVIVSYYGFVLVSVKLWTRTIQYLTYILIGIFAVMMLLVWAGQVFEPTTAQKGVTSLTTIGYMAGGVLVVYIVVAFWLVLSSKNKSLQWLYIPSALMLIGIMNNLITPNLRIDAVAFTLAALWSAREVLKHQIFDPLTHLNVELQRTNQELRQAIDDLAHEKEHIEELNNHLEDANRYKNDFLANMSHELRTPLNSIVGYSELLLSPIYGNLNSQQQDRLERIRRNGVNLAHLIDSILDITKLDSGHTELETQHLSPTPIFDTVCTKINAYAQEKSLVFTCDIDDTLPRIVGDKGRIEQMVYLLVDNAVKFTKEGSVTLAARSMIVQNGETMTVSLPARGWLRDGIWLLITVTDTGIGIDPEDFSRIFVNFAQLDGSRTREHGGIGLGLAIAKRLTELHYGSIWVDSTKGLGSTFYVALPAEPVPVRTTQLQIS